MKCKLCAGCIGIFYIRRQDDVAIAFKKANHVSGVLKGFCASSVSRQALYGKESVEIGMGFGGGCQSDESR